jgi:hypothetical protein
MSYLVGVKLQSGEIVHRQAENISDLPYVTDDGETLCVVHDQDDFPFTADIGGGLRSGGRAFAGRGLPPAGRHGAAIGVHFGAHFNGPGDSGSRSPQMSQPPASTRHCTLRLQKMQTFLLKSPRSCNPSVRYPG